MKLNVAVTKQPYALTWEDQINLFSNMDIPLRRVALFMVNTGASLRQVRYLKWEWELTIPDKNKAVFVAPNKPSEILALNSIASRIVGYMRCFPATSEYVFGDPDQDFWINSVDKIQNSVQKLNEVEDEDPGIIQQFEVAWHSSKLPWGEANLVSLEENLRATFEHRLIIAGVALEDIDTLLGVNPRIGLTSQIDTRHLLECVEKIVKRDNCWDVIAR